MRTDESPFRIYNAESLGRAVRHYREQAELTQAELATKLGVRRPTLVALESGKMTEQTRLIVAALKQLGARIIVQPADW